MKYKQKPSGIWFVEFEGDNGERRRVSTGIKTARQKTVPPDVKAKARDIVLGLVPAARSGRQARTHAKPAGVTMRDLFDKAQKTVWSPEEAKAQATIISNVKILNELEVTTRDARGTPIRTWIFGDEPASDVTFSALEDVVAALKAKGNAPATVKRKLDMVSKALRMGTKWTDKNGRPLVLSKPVMPSIRVANLKDRVVYGEADAHLLGVPNEEAAIFAAIEKRRVAEPSRPWFRMEALVRFLLDVGGRLSESLNTGQTDIGFRPVLTDTGAVIQRPVVTFPRHQTKSDKPRTVPLTDAAWAAIQSQKDHMGIRTVKTTDGPVKKLTYFPLLTSAVWYMFSQIKEDVAKEGIDLSDVSLHTFRHTCLSRLARGGMDLLRLQQWAGHSDPKITADRYAHLIPSSLMDGLLILGSSNGTTPPIKNGDGISPDIEPFMETGANRANFGTGVPH